MYLPKEVVELATCLEVQTPVFLNWNEWKRKQVRSTRNVSLKIDQNRLPSPEVILYLIASYPDILVQVTNEVRTNHAVITSPYRVRSSLRHNEVDVFKLFPALDDSCDQLLIMQLLESVVWLTLPNRVKEDLLLGQRTFAHV